MVERTTRHTMLLPLNAKDATAGRTADANALRSLPSELTKTLSNDQGTERSRHTQFTRDTAIAVDVAQPGSPWERGTNEHTNGLIWQSFPKGTEFDTVSARETKRVQRELNDHPRAVLHWKKPIEVITHPLREKFGVFSFPSG